MKKTSWTSLVLIAAMGLSQGSALAQPRHDNEQQCNPGERGCGRGNGQHNGQRGWGYQDNRRGDMGRQDHGGERGAGPEHDFYRGGRLPPQYRSRQYVVNDWRGHGLRSPPRGYQWVQTGGDYVLVAIATGIILELLLNR